MLNSLAYQMPKIETSLDEERKKKIYNAMATSEQFNSDGSLTPQSFSEIYAKIKYEYFSAGEVVFRHGKLAYLMKLFLYRWIRKQLLYHSKRLSECSGAHKKPVLTAKWPDSQEWGHELPAEEIIGFYFSTKETIYWWINDESIRGWHR